MSEKWVRLKSLVRQIYGGLALKPGDLLPAPVPERTAERLVAMHIAEYDAQADGTEAPTATPTAPKKRGRPKGSYNRRDMRAKE